jgi:hypothetical protein
MKTLGKGGDGGGGMAPPFFTSTLVGGEQSASCLATLPMGEEPPVPLDRILDGSQSQSEHSAEEKNLFLLLGIKTQLSGVRPIAVLIGLSQLTYLNPRETKLVENVT